jgi:hypothetical protein
MKGKSLLTIGAALVLASSPMAGSWAQSDGLDVTVRVLDDVSDVTAVIAGIDNPPIGDQPGQQADEREPGESSSAEAAGAETPRAAPLGSLRRGALGLESELDREEEGEGEIEDFDVPEDIVLPVFEE